MTTSRIIKENTETVSAQAMGNKDPQTHTQTLVVYIYNVCEDYDRNNTFHIP